MSSSLQLSGLASGLDWKTLVDQLIQAESTPVTTATNQKYKNSSKISTLDTLKSNLTALQSSIKAFSDSDSFASRSAKIADSSSSWSASAAAGTAEGQYVFNVTKLATKSARGGTSNLGSPISASSNVSGVTLATMNLSTAITAGDFTVNGTKITIATTDSLADVFQKISDATSGAVTASYDSTSDAVSLQSNSAIVIGSASDTSNFLTALKLYNSSETTSAPYTIASLGKLGVPVLSSTIANAGLKLPITNTDTDGNGKFFINGVQIDFNANTDSLQAVLSRINSSAAGVTASYDKSSDKFTLTNKVTGNLGLTVSETSGGFLEALGLNSTSSFKAGDNAVFNINNGTSIVSTSNNFTADVTGITGLSVTASGTGWQTVTVAGDNTDLRSNIDKFISAYNAVQDYIDTQTKITIGSDGKATSATFAGDLDVTDIGRRLRSMVFGAVPGLSGTIKRLSDIGIDFKSGSSNLEISSSAKLNDALTNRMPDVITLFTNSSGGLVSQLDIYISRITGTGGTLESKTSSLNKQNTQLDQQIARLNAQLAAERTRLTDQFVQMETAQSALQSQLKALQNAFATKSDDSSS